MKSNFLPPLLGSLLYFASPVLCQLEVRQQTTSYITIKGTTHFITGTTFYFTGGTTYYFTGGTTYYFTGSSGQAKTYTITNSQALVTSSANSQTTATTTSATSQAPASTTRSPRPSVTPTTKVLSIPPVTISGEAVSVTYSGEFLPLPTGPTPSTVATPTRSRGDLKKMILAGLEKVPGIELFTALVKAQSDIFELLNPESNYTILALDNDAVKAKTGGVWRRSEGYSPNLALSFIERGIGDPPLTAGPRTWKTILKEPKYVNLGPDEPARLVSSPMGANINIVTGMGASVSFGAQDVPYDAGTINVGKGESTLPRDLSTTLRNTNGTEFEKFLSSCGQLENLSNSEYITIFALTDAAVASAGASLTKSALDQHIRRGPPGFSPDFVIGEVYDTTAGGKIKVTDSSDDLFINGVKIVKRDVIMTNGVVHYVEGIIGPYTGPLPSSPAPSPSSTGTAKSNAGRPSISPFITLLAMAAAFARYCLMA